MFSNQIENKVQDFCRPFFKETAINYFDYGHYKINGEFFGTTSLLECQFNYLNKDLYLTLSECLGIDESCAILSEIIPLPEFFLISEKKWTNNIKSAASHNLPHRFYFVKFTESYMEHYGFGASVSAYKMLSFFMARINVMEKFCYLFKHHFRELINEISHEKIILENYVDTNVESFVDPASLYIDETMLSPLNISSYSINNGNREVSLNQTEILHMSFFANGYTAKEIAKIFQLSNRTVDYHLNKVKDKLNICSKNQIRDIYYTSDLKKLIPSSDLYLLHSMRNNHLS